MNFYTSNVAFGMYLLVAVICITAFVMKKFPQSGFAVFFDMVFEKAYDFFEDILGKDEKPWIITYILVMFFIIVFANVLGWAIEMVAPMFGVDEKKTLMLEHYIAIPTGEKNFNIAMAAIGVVIVILEQFKFLGFKKALYEYLPVFGKDYIPYTRGKFSPAIDWPLFLLVKFFDIVISIFLGVLEIIGHIAKIVSLSFRLFGNIMSGGLLLGMLVAGVSALTVSLTGIEFPIIGPVIIHLQGMLVALIQALVFPLLIAIFIKVAKVH